MNDSQLLKVLKFNDECLIILDVDGKINKIQDEYIYYIQLKKNTLKF